MTKKPAFWIAVIFAVTFVLVMITATRGLGGTRVEVCLEFRGQNVCRVASGVDEKEATEKAKQNACALVSSGVTDSIACQNTPTKRVTRLDK